MRTTKRILGTLLVFTACSFVFVMLAMYVDTAREEAKERECIAAFRTGGYLSKACADLCE
jgi:zinc transporter ZupT